MIYPVELLIEGQDLVTASEQQTVRESLVLMVSHDYSQLPIVDEDGDLTGLISEQSISRHYFHLGDKVPVLDIKAADCSEKPKRLPLESDVLDALSLLKQVASVVIVDGRKPVGIVTNADAIAFFRDYSEGLVLIEDMETTLRQTIDEMLPTERDREQALENAFRHLRKQNNRELSFDRLTLGDYINLIVNSSNWERFATRFESKTMFQAYMDQVRDIRNQLMHFRGRLDAVQYDVLGRAHNWLADRDRRYSTMAQTIQLEGTSFALSGAEATLSVSSDTKKAASGKYGPLQDWLSEEAKASSAGRRIELTFDQIETILGTDLPESAHKHRSWWANHASQHSQSSAWLRSGWEVAGVDNEVETVTFRRTDTARYQTFWLDLVEMLREKRPGLTRAEWTDSRNWWQFGAGKTGLYFGWSFTNDRMFSTSVIVDTGDRDLNDELYAKLLDQRETIERELEEQLVWDRSPNTQYRVIAINRPGTIHDSELKLDELKAWGLRQMLNLVNVMQPRIREL